MSQIKRMLTVASMVYSVTAADIRQAPIERHGSEDISFKLRVLTSETNAKAEDTIQKYVRAVAELAGTKESAVTVLSMEQTTSEAIKVEGENRCRKNSDY